MDEDEASLTEPYILGQPGAAVKEEKKKKKKMKFSNSPDAEVKKKRVSVWV